MLVACVISAFAITALMFYLWMCVCWWIQEGPDANKDPEPWKICE